jgi:phytoene synthase
VIEVAAASVPTVAKDNREIIARGSKSFFLASLVFSRTNRQACWTLYRWCRHCDDLVDRAKTKSDAVAAVTLLRAQTQSALAGEDCGADFAGLFALAKTHKIPTRHFFELIEGFEMDAAGTSMETLADVERYSYHVAGVVGLLMSYIMGVRDLRALENAVSMGVAMQLTNIARDVQEDLALGRIYLPGDWLRQAGLSSSDLLANGLRPSGDKTVSALKTRDELLFSLVLRLLDRAEELYEHGQRGLGALPMRSSLAVAVAAEVYSSIGKKIRRRGLSSLYARIYVTTSGKLLLSLKAISKTIPIHIKGLIKVWESV